MADIQAQKDYEQQKAKDALERMRADEAAAMAALKEAQKKEKEKIIKQNQVSNKHIWGPSNYANRYKAGIRNNLTKTYIPFIVMPEGLNETINANFTQQAIVGASIPRIVYSSTQAKTLNLSLKNMSEDYIPEGFSNLQQYIRALQALVYPDYKGDTVKSPNLTLYLGNRSMSCVCTNVTVSWRRFSFKFPY